MNDMAPTNRSESRRPHLLPNLETVEVRLDEILRIFWRRKWILTITSAVLFGIGFLYVQSLTPKYEAAGTVMIRPSEQQVVDIQSLVAGLPADDETIATEIEVVRSRDLAERVVVTAGLDQTDEFNPLLREDESWLAWLGEQGRAILPQAWASRIDEVFPPEPERTIAPDVLQTLMVDKYLRGLTVEQIGTSRALEIRFSSEDPQLAQRVVNTTADLYVVQYLNAKFDTAQRASSWLNERVEELRRQVRDAEQAVEEFSSGSMLVDGREREMVLQELSELSSQLVQARAEFEATRARLSRVEELVNAGQSRAVFDILDSPLINGLRAEQSTLEQRRAELSAQYAAGHPVMQNIRAEIASLQQQMDIEAGNLIEGLRNEVRVGRQRVTSLSDSISELRQRTDESDDEEVQLRALEREAEASRNLLQTLLERVKEAERQIELEQPEVFVLSKAPLPLIPSEPNTKLLLLVCFVGAVGAGVGLMFMAELLDQGYRSGEQLEQDLQLHAYGMVPKLRSGTFSRQRPQDYVMDKPGSAFAEAIRTFYTSILIALQKANGGNVIMITSAELGEGKSALTTSLARIVAKAGQRVLVIDGDLRRPQVHQIFRLSNKAGLSTYLSGSGSLDDILQCDTRSGAHAITAGPEVEDPQLLFRLPAMQHLLSRLRTQYDLIIIDAPPVLPVSDPRVLSSLADLCVLAVRWGETSRAAVRSAVKQLHHAGANLEGAVLTQVDIKTYSLYGYQESAYYYSKQQGYYTS